MSADEQGAHLWTGRHHVLLPQLAQGLGVAGWQPSGNTVQCEARGGRRSLSTLPGEDLESREDTGQPSGNTVP